MRPLRLDLAGFTVFRDPTTIDFTGADFFALVGPTGAGKSSVLDGICFALYGTVPRWDDRRSIENALAPSAAQARVRLVFSAGAARYVASRVVRRDSKGKVSTSHAGLERLPDGFDLAAFDTAPAQRGADSLGTVLAGTPAEMDAAVVAAVGLPYEQFTSSILLPQGEFARFLHAKPKERQDILVNLLGLNVYRRVAERAGAVQRDAESRANAMRGLLADLVESDDAALDAAHRKVRAGRELVTAVEAELPALVAATEAGNTAQARLAAVDHELSLLAAVQVPGEVATVSKQADQAAELAEQADAEVLAAEEKEEKLAAELAAAGDRIALRKLADLWSEREGLVARIDTLAAAARAATTGHAAAASAVDAAARIQQASADAVAAAAAAMERAQTADRAASLRVHLVAGQPCPVCEQEVSTVPAAPKTPALTAARRAATNADKAAATATQRHQVADRELREADRVLAAASAQHTDAVDRLAETDTALAGQPALSVIRTQLVAIDGKERALAEATTSRRSALQRSREAKSAAQQTQEAVTRAWRVFDQTRDTLATFSPPAPDRDDLARAWQQLRAWARSAGAERETSRDRLLDAAQAALAELSSQVTRLERLLRDAGAGPVTVAVEPAGYRQAAALGLERAEAALQRIQERREQADRLTVQVGELDHDAQVARSLALHLRADRFERWLLAEALDALVTDASRIMRELSSGQYDLDHDKGEFFVVDHTDAGLRRGVRTLSGGETFQASLALALALSEQLAGLSPTASLESTLLDEGFGTLDATSLDTVAATLENLAARGDRMVGVVTHVAALAERIPVRYEVTRDARGAARVERSG
jgi:exonuclease SbcC